MNSVPGQSREDLHQVLRLQKTPLSHVPGENLDDHHDRELKSLRSVPQYEDHDWEMECQRTVQFAALSSVLGVNRGGPRKPARPGTEGSTICSTERYTPTSTTTTRNRIVDVLLEDEERRRHFLQLSANCGSRGTTRCTSHTGRDSTGTSITCSATTGKELRRRLSTSTGCSTICITGTSRAWTSKADATVLPNVPGGGGFGRRGASYVSPSTPLSHCCDAWQQQLPSAQQAARVSRRHEVVGCVVAKRTTGGHGSRVQHQPWMSPAWVSAK